MTAQILDNAMIHAMTLVAMGTTLRLAIHVRQTTIVPGVWSAQVGPAAVAIRATTRVVLVIPTVDATTTLLSAIVRLISVSAHRALITIMTAAMSAMEVENHAAARRAATMTTTCATRIRAVATTKTLATQNTAVVTAGMTAAIFGRCPADCRDKSPTRTWPLLCST